MAVKRMMLVPGLAAAMLISAVAAAHAQEVLLEDSFDTREDGSVIRTDIWEGNYKDNYRERSGYARHGGTNGGFRSKQTFGTAGAHTMYIADFVYRQEADGRSSANYFGFYDDWKGIWFMVPDAPSNRLHAYIASEGAGAFDTDTGVDLVLNKDYRFRIEWEPGVSAKYYLDEKLLAAHTDSRVPTMPRPFQVRSETCRMALGRVSISGIEAERYETVGTGKISATFDKEAGVLVGLRRAGRYIKAKGGIFAPYLVPGLGPGGSGQLPDALSPAAQKSAHNMARGAARGGTVEFEITDRGTNSANVRSVWRTDKAIVTQEWRLEDGADEMQAAVEAEILADTYEILFVAGNIEGLPEAVILPEAGRTAYGHDYRRTPAFLCVEAGDRDTGFCVSVPPPGSKANPDFDRVATGDGPSLFVYLRGITPSTKKYRGSFTLGLGEPQEGPPQWQAMEGEPWKTQAPVVIVDVWPNRIIYDNLEDGNISVTLLNCTSREQEAALQIDLERGLTEKESLKPVGLTLKPGERKKVEVPFNSGAADFGVRAVVRVLSDGREVHRARETFAVATDWGKLIQYCLHYLKGYPWGEVQDIRENYISMMHRFQWYPNEGTLAPRGDVNRIYDTLQFKKGGSDIWWKQLNECCHKMGIRTNMYYGLGLTGPGADWEIDPAMMTYTQDGQPLDQASLYDPRFREFLADEFIKAIDYFGWDGCMLDCITVFNQGEIGEFSFFNYRDVQGRKSGLVMGPDADAAGAAWLNELKQRVREKHPGFLFIGNGTSSGTGFLHTTGLGPKVYLASEGVMTEFSGSSAGVWSNDGVGTWKGMVACQNTHNRGRHTTEVDGQTLDKYPHFMYAPTPYGGPISTRTFLGLCFANGFHTYTYWPIEALDLRGQAHSSYNRFSLRWGEFLYDLERIEWVPPEKADFISVQTPGPVLWKDYVYWRKRDGGGRDLMVHFLNLPPEEHTMNNARPPETRRDISVSLNLPGGALVDGVWWLSPDEGGEPQKLKYSLKGDRLTTSIPTIEYYGLMVIRTHR